MPVTFVNNQALLSDAFNRIANQNVGLDQALAQATGAVDKLAQAGVKQWRGGQIAQALGQEGTDYGAAATRAAELGDQDLALKYASLRDADLARQADIAYKNEYLRLQGLKATADAAKAGQDEIKAFIKDNPQIQTAGAVQAMLDENTQLYDTFDEDIKGRDEYAQQSGAGASLSALARRIGGGTSASERTARKKFETLKKQSVVELRQQFKGQGQISEGETDLLRAMETARNPYEFEVAGKQLVDMWNRRTASNAQIAGIDLGRIYGNTGTTPTGGTSSKYSGLM